MNLNIGLYDEQRTAVVKILNTLLSDEYLLYTKTRNYHWNVLGPQFNDLHKFFEEQYTELNVVVDDAPNGRGLSAGGHWAHCRNSHRSPGLKKFPANIPMPVR